MVELAPIEIRVKDRRSLIDAFKWIHSNAFQAHIADLISSRNSVNYTYNRALLKTHLVLDNL